ncbi:MAG: hypothetical protein HZB53_21735 [Chloroflexi bacterium]|nr:hypothetical protein [Chloroflexota bacterium]
MNDSVIHSRWIRLAVVVIVALIVAGGTAYAAGLASLIPSANRLASAGLDEETGYYNPPGVNGRIPNGWSVILENGNPTFFSSCEEKGDCSEFNGSEKLSGTSSQYILSENSEPSGKPFKVDLYQTVLVTPGVPWSVSGFMLSFCGGTYTPPNNPCPQGYTIGKSIGLDPYGGTDPSAPTVIWTAEDGREAREAGWVRLTNVVYARSPSMTVFLRMNWPHTWHGALGWMDEVRLVPAPTATMGYVAPLQGTNSFSVSAQGWRDSSFKTTGQYKIYWDIEARDVLSSTWYRVLTDTTATPPLKDNTGVTTTFTGQFGRTYILRAIPTVHHIPYCEWGCDWPEQVYLGFPSDPITVTIGDNVPPVSSVAPLAAVQVTGTFAVAWTGTDNATPANQLVYDIQSRDNASAWTDWLTSTSTMTALFSGQRGHTYDFRSRARDQSNNVEAYPGTPDATTTVDGTPPSAQVSVLAATQRTATFTVRWAGNDNATPANRLVFDIQSRDNGGGWGDWLTGTVTTTAPFSGQPGHTYDFRARAHDLAGNSGAYASTPDATTVVALATVSGTARNLRGQLLAFPRAALTPPVLADPGTPDGAYTLYVTTSATYALTVARDGYGALPPIGGIVVTTTNVADADAILPPALDLMANGQFESGDLSGWTLAGEVTTTAAAHSGLYAVTLGATPGVESSIQQTLYLSPTLGAPTLSYLYRGAAGAAQPFTVTVSSGAIVTQVTPVAGDGWTHGWLDLSAFAGQTITVTLACQPAAPGAMLWLDELSAGDAIAIPVYRLYLPAIAR